MGVVLGRKVGVGRGVQGTKEWRMVGAGASWGEGAATMLEGGLLSVGC